MRIEKAILEKMLDVKLKMGTEILGLDTATRTGWAISKVCKKYITITCGYIDTKNDDIYEKYNEIVYIFNDLIFPKHIVIVEDTFFSFNPKMFRMISRIGAIAYTIASLKGCHVEYIGPSQARKLIGIKGNSKKAIAHLKFKELYKIEETDNDIIDAIILSFAGMKKLYGRGK